MTQIKKESHYLTPEYWKEYLENKEKARNFYKLVNYVTKKTKAVKKLEYIEKQIDLRDLWKQNMVEFNDSQLKGFDKISKKMMGKPQNKKKKNEKIGIDN